MSEQSIPVFTSTSMTNEEKPTPTLAEVVRKYDTEQLIKFLREENDDLKLDKDDLKIIHKEKTTGRNFFMLSKQDFRDCGFKVGPATTFADFAKSLDADIISILPFKPETVDIDSNDEDLKYCVTDLKRNIRLYGSASEINEAERCHYISSIIHASIHITRKITNKTIIPKCQFEIIGNERTDLVDYAIKVKDNSGNNKLIAITEAKQSEVLLGFGQNILQLTASYQKNENKRKQKAEQAFSNDAFDYLYGVVTIAIEWYFILYTPKKFYCLKNRYSINIDKSALEDNSRFCQDVKKVVQVLVSLLKDRVEVDESPDRYWRLTYTAVSLAGKGKYLAVELASFIRNEFLEQEKLQRKIRSFIPIDNSENLREWDYKNDFGEDALKKLYQAQEACQRLILLRLFTMHLSNLSEQAKNRLFLAFSRSNSFGVLEHNALLDALAHPVKGLNLVDYDELGFDLINNAKL
ncbi:1948_t:CDS:2 [Gigaspora margarita]|uniref:1948_t:CDS:1 n=1 Tax=Gigaspora margarita TaxID=4874 RepID=A0ABN7UGB5_GIGMA|nr:1948_t:CDS:2 [Gigaspora margarita]